MRTTLPWAAVLAGGLAVAVAAAAHLPAATAGRQAPAEPATAAAVADAVLGAMDRSAQPCADFYRYACGGWLDRAEIAPGKLRAGRSILAIVSGTDAWLDAALRPGGSLASTRPGVLFRTCVAAAAAGAPPPAALARLAPALAGSRSPLPSVEAIFTALGKQHASGLGGGVLFQLSVSREYETGAQMPKLRPVRTPTDVDESADPAAPAAAARRAVATDALAFACRVGWAHNCTAAGRPRNGLIQAVLGLERAIAALPTPEAVARVQPERLPLIRAYLTAAGVPNARGPVLLLNAPYFDALFDTILADPVARSIMPTYFAYAVTLDLTKRDLLGSKMAASWMAYLAATDPAAHEERTSVADRCRDRAVSGLLDEVSRGWVAENVVPADTAAMAAILNDTRAAAAAVVAATSWLDEPSKEAAALKMTAATINNGADPAYDPYDDVSVVPTGDGAYVANMLSVSAAAWRRAVAPPVSAEARWQLPAFAFDASYAPWKNLVTMTSAVQRWPLLPSATAAGVPAALAYGGAAFVAGHEFGHALDARGVFFNASGVLVNGSILSPASRRAFADRADCVVRQYSAYEVDQLGNASAPVRLDGKVTLTENMADAFGVRVAADALAVALRSRLSSGRVAAANAALAEVLTDEQLYWVAVGQTWCAKRTDANLRRQIVRGPHSPEPFRVLGPLSQSTAFAKAFDCPAGSRYRPAQTCTVYGA